MTNFKRGELTKKSYKVIMFDLYGVIDSITTTDKRYHFKLLEDNLKDIFGKRIVKAVEKEEE